ncbi:MULTISPECIES: hypothetical protein [unclassified Shinella]|uniref:hypothetical protein n=1 Tax=unclassified Shinella TaxID=2643062 RepID=UPI00234F28F6|nr:MULTISPECIES: hypothetical protein [unclassified Shinella]MCO5154076.1 DUF1612 domain-containing protein [Shinella sp.]MDC7266998.1 DUF1612 domain-containing protein [Shinella sp. HY16]MDC7273895.1 DUF1612 domain-containing protein [Shinella sp. YZ44]
MIVIPSLSPPRPRSSASQNAIAAELGLKEHDRLMLGISPPKAVCPDLLIGFKCMPYVMRYNDFAH